MKAIQILMDENLLRELDRQAKRSRTDRSKLIRTAAARYLGQLKRESLEAKHRRGYEAAPTTDDVDAWQEIQAWPES
jgi:metal-responsive CopG/Arc/MetJ family transcriptional regulator